MTQSVVGPPGAGGLLRLSQWWVRQGPGVCYDSVSGGSARGRGFVMTQSVVGPPGAGVC